MAWTVLLVIVVFLLICINHVDSATASTDSNSYRSREDLHS